MCHGGLNPRPTPKFRKKPSRCSPDSARGAFKRMGGKGVTTCARTVCCRAKDASTHATHTTIKTSMAVKSAACTENYNCKDITSWFGVL